MRTQVIRPLMLLMGLITLSGCQQSVRTIVFDPQYEVAGEKIAIKDINPDLPTDWTPYNFVTLEMRASNTQRLRIGFTTSEGYNELKVMSYCPGEWNRLTIPLKFFTQEPGAAVDLAATYNQPRATGWVNLGGRRGPLMGVDSIGVRLHRPIGTQYFQIRDISLSVEDPGDAYLGTRPVIDSLGQCNLVEYPGKAHSLEELSNAWSQEERELEADPDFGYAKFGGYASRKVKATGFFRTEKIDGRWWFVDPEGYLFLSVGVDCITPGRAGILKMYDQRDGMFQAVPPQDLFPVEVSRRNMGEWNLYRRYGAEYATKSVDMVFRRMEAWGVNTIGNWSSQNVIRASRKAFMATMGTAGVERDLMGLADIYGEDFNQRLEEAMTRSLAPYIGNPWVIGFFIGNEPAWIGHEVRLCQMILDGKDRPIQKALSEVIARQGDTPEVRTAFIRDTFKQYIRAVVRLQKKVDPDHLNLGYRFGNLDEVSEDVLRICGEAFDVLSFNCYAIEPSRKMMDRALTLTDRPMIIGEYHFGTVDHGLAPSLLQVDSQAERGTAYRYYTEQAYSHPGLIGTAYFQWCDQDITGRNDGENYNCGLLDVTDRPYREQVEAMKATARVLLEVHSGTAAPFSQKPRRVATHSYIPDYWNR